MFEQSVLEKAIAKYGGADEAYKQKLKLHIRNAMGYSNYMNRLGQETGAPADIGDVKGLSPAGINARIGTRFGMQKENVNTLGTIAGAFDTAAGQIAANQVAEGKKAAADRKNLQFKPTNWAESEIVNYIKNPVNQDGTPMSVQQLRDKLKGQMIGEGGFEDVTEQMIDQRINEWVPKDFEQNAKQYSYMAMGYTKAQAQDLNNFDRYANGKMSLVEKETYALTNPTWAAKAEQMKAAKGLIPDIGEQVKDEATGETIPKYSYQELINKYPNIDPKSIAEYAKPVFNQYLADDIKKELPIGSLESAIKDKALTIDTWAEFMNSDEYKNFKKAIVPIYGGMYTDQELDIIIHNQLMSQL